MTEVEKRPDTDSHQNGPAKKKRRGRGKSKPREQKPKLDPQDRPDNRTIVRDNENMVKYYKLQPILEQGEFEEFMACLKETLPASFRINTFDIGQADFLKRLVEAPEFFTSPSQSDTTSDQIPQDILTSSLPDSSGKDPQKAGLEPMPWYPNRWGWQMNISRVDIRKSPILQQLHRFLIAETENGFISRQEAVSMIPPLMLDVHRGQNILDMCAAPGSKTAQLLEYLKFDLKKNKPFPRAQSDDIFDDGMVVANDVDNKRCYMLVHQSSRLNSPNCVIINEDASRLPKMKTFSHDKTEEFEIKFDRILCDVPCSGDGTVRKNPDVWRKWTVGNANNFHGMQCKILRRGVELLKEDGLLVYSTCSMNPIENEAVIASILRASEGSMSLVDIRDKLPGLKYRSGISTWTVMNNQMTVIPSFDQVPTECSSQLYPSLFPPTDEESKCFKLERCIRILPHLQNTGAFFVAVMKKVKMTLPWETSQSTQKAPSDLSKEVPKPSGNPQRKRKLTGFKEDPFIFMNGEDEDWKSIKSVYGLCDDFPVEQLAYRCSAGKKRKIYLMSKRTRNFIIANKEESGKEDFVKIINGGLRLFNRADTEAGFRICQDGVSEIISYIKDEIKVPLSKSDLVALLKAQNVPFDALSTAQEIKSSIKPGSFIFVYRHTDDGESATMPLVAWKGEKTVSLYVSRTYRVHLCALAKLRIEVDTSDQSKDNTEVTQ